MAFLKRKKVKFSVDLQVSNLSDVPLVNAVLFAKVRLLDGGNFEDLTERVEVVSHSASWSHRSSFSCRISSDPTTGMLEKCLCRISIRKEQKGGKSYVKLGYVDINLSEFAASGVEGITRSYLLDGYGLNQRQDNSKVQVKVIMCHQSADPYFRVPRIACATDDKSLNPLDRKAPEDFAFEPVSSGRLLDEEVMFRPTTANDVAPEVISNDGSSGTTEDTCSVVSERRINPTSLRRMSQDRSSAPRVQSTRIDPGGIIDKMLAESCLSESGDVPVEDSEGLALYVDRDGAAVVGPQGAGLQKVTLGDGT
ncbi:unnamed protein product [Auanema sp. JU1783]|nr:unnamed protein product [Auanema sp. JU1783]